MSGAMSSLPQCPMAWTGTTLPFLTLRNPHIVSVLRFVLFEHASPPSNAFLDQLTILCLIVLTGEEKSEAKYKCPSASHEGIWGIGDITPRTLNLGVRWM